MLRNNNCTQSLSASNFKTYDSFCDTFIHSLVPTLPNSSNTKMNHSWWIWMFFSVLLAFQHFKDVKHCQRKWEKAQKTPPCGLPETSVQWFSKWNPQTRAINKTWDPVSKLCPEVHWGTVVYSQGHQGTPQNFKGLPAILDTCQTQSQLLVQGGRQFWHELNSPFYNAVSLQRRVFHICCDKKAKAVLKTNVEQKIRVVTSDLSPSFEKLCTDQPVHTSHY